MSRTDHHRPYRVRANDPLEPSREARHWHTLGRYSRHTYEYGIDGLLTECDLGQHPLASWQRNREDADTCTWELTWSYRPYARKSNREERRVYYHGPERHRVKNMARDVVRSYRDPRDVAEWDFNNRQARHTVDWLVN